MRIIELKAENIKNLKAIEITPEGNAVILTGKNGAGKSAILDSIFMTLTGKKIEQPIREGEERAEVTVNLGDYTVKKVFTGKGERLEILSADGAKYPSPQTFLNKIMGDLSFDPLAFSKMKEKEQHALLTKVVGLNFEDLDKKRVELYNERTIANRKVASLSANIQAIPKPSNVGPEEEVSFAEESKKISILRECQTLYALFLETVNSLREDVQKKKALMKEHEEEILRLQEEHHKLKDECLAIAEKGKALIAKAPEKITSEMVDKAVAKLSEVEEFNGRIRSANQYHAVAAELKTAKETADTFGKQIDALDSEKKKRIISSKFPLPGLSVDETTVFYEKKPFSQLSTGEQIKVSTAIAMNLNPKLRVILIREGSLLDKVGLDAITAMAKDNDYQLWIEKVLDNKQMGIYIENGEIK